MENQLSNYNKYPSSRSIPSINNVVNDTTLNEEIIDPDLSCSNSNLIKIEPVGVGDVHKNHVNDTGIDLSMYHTGTQLIFGYDDVATKDIKSEPLGLENLDDNTININQAQNYQSTDYDSMRVREEQQINVGLTGGLNNSKRKMSYFSNYDSSVIDKKIKVEVQDESDSIDTAENSTWWCKDQNSSNYSQQDIDKVLNSSLGLVNDYYQSLYSEKIVVKSEPESAMSNNDDCQCGNLHHDSVEIKCEPTPNTDDNSTTETYFGIETLLKDNPQTQGENMVFGLYKKLFKSAVVFCIKIIFFCEIYIYILIWMVFLFNMHSNSTLLANY